MEDRFKIGSPEKSKKRNINDLTPEERDILRKRQAQRQQQEKEENENIQESNKSDANIDLEVREDHTKTNESGVKKVTVPNKAHEKYRKAAETSVNKIIKEIRNFADLSYKMDFDIDDANKALNALKKELDTAKRKYTENNENQDIFKF